MTVETQTFVTPNDIVGVCLRCTCGAKVSIPFRAKGKRVNMSCPSCDQHWFQGEHDERFMALNGCITRLIELQNLKTTFDLGITLELSSEAKKAIARAASRDSGDVA